MNAKHSTEHLTNEVEQLRHVVLWLAAQLHGPVVNGVYNPQLACFTCGHDITDHDSPNDEVSSPCLFPASLGAPSRLCRCERFSG